jgi:hypothetical protein
MLRHPELEQARTLMSETTARRLDVVSAALRLRLERA